MAVGSVAAVMAMPLGATAPEVSAATPTCAGVPATIVGTAGADRIVGTAHRDVIVGLGGDDRIIARGGDDLICGGPGNDVASGDAGSDRLRGGPGSDALYGGWGADRLRGGTGADWLWGGRGSDVLVGWRGNDRLRGGAGLDPADGGPGIDLCLSPAPPSARGCENTERIARAAFLPSISAHGRYVAFASTSAHLVPGDTNGAVDAFVYDRRRDVTTRVSVASDGRQANGGVFSVAIAADVPRVAFVSYASNLVANDTNRKPDVFVRAVRTGVTSRVSVATGGGQAEGTSGLDRVALSADGRFVAFTSDAPNLVPDDTNGITDVFVHDTRTGVTTRVSVATDGSQALPASGHQPGSFRPTISADGRYVAFSSTATELVPNDANDAEDVFVHDMRTGATSRVFVPQNTPPDPPSGSFDPAISAHGRYVAFESTSAHVVPGDRNHVSDVFERDRLTGATWRVSVATDGSGSNGSFNENTTISGNGRYVAFDSDATNLVRHDTNEAQDVFVHDARTGRTTRVSVLTSGRQRPSGSQGPSAISADGCCVAFSAEVQADVVRPDLFVRLVR